MLYDQSHDYNLIGKTLLQAAKRIEEFGHLKDNVGTVNGPNCLLGAVNMVTIGYPSNFSSHRPTEHHITKDKINISCRCMILLDNKLIEKGIKIGVIRWNNQIERTPQEVIDLLREVAATQKLEVSS